MPHWARWQRTGLLLATLAAFALPETAAFAQTAQTRHPNQAAARSAYDRAVSLHARKEFAAAAREFALADQLISNDSVLADALDAAVAADDPVFGSMLAVRAARRPQNVELQRAASKAKEKFRGRAGRIELRCPERCDAQVDGKPLDADNEGWLTTGTHTITLTTPTYPDHRDEHRVEIAYGETTLVTFAPPKPASPALATEPKPVDTERHGMAPTWFWIGAGVTAAFAAGATVSWIDASNSHKDFVERGCANKGSTDCLDRAEDGKSSLTRTNILIGGAAVSAVATAVVGLFLVDWKPRGEGAAVRTSFVVGPSDARAVLIGRF